MKSETMSFRCSLAAAAKIKKEAKAAGESNGSYLTALVETTLKEPAETRLKMLDYHDEIINACNVLHGLIQSGETYLRTYDYDQPDIGMIEKFLAEMKLKNGIR